MRYFAFPADAPTPKRIHEAGGPETPLSKYLDYYRGVNTPGYAVLVTGEWGIGKTHQVKLAFDEDQYHYVSLFGLRTAEELRSAVFAQMYPSRHRIKGLVGDARQALSAASGLFALGSLTPALFGAFLDKNISAERILIFDDLERSRMSLKVLLGVINNYVEHFGCRVVVIAHDDKVLDSYLTQAKEKLFGQTLKAVPQTNEAFESFLKRHEGTAFGDFIDPYAQDLIDIFMSSGQPSLRLLKHLIEDLRRFHSALTDRHQAHLGAMTEAIRMISVFAIETRANELKPEDLIERAKSVFGDNQSRIAELRAKYGTIALESTTLSDALLTSMFVDGIFDSNAIRSSLDQSQHFLPPADLPPWRKVISFDELDDAEVAAAAALMESQIESLQPLDPGEMLHILALRLMMAEHAISDNTPIESVAEAKAYIDAMLQAGNIPPRTLDDTWRYERFDAHDGTGFWVSEKMKGHFAQITGHLKQARETALERKLETEATPLLEALNDGEQFFELMVTTYKGNNRYAHVPILHKIDPADFVSAWLRAPKNGWYWISNSINERYKAGFQTTEMRQEWPWARQVVALLRQELDKLDGFAKLRLARALPAAVGDNGDDELIEGTLETAATLDPLPSDVKPAANEDDA
ncbi:MAG: hypothetical protein EON58_00555 [Alphaproteobacteria bacterium]|nr:MAG: hypothetical protein EON58_00555 [Alphaproteobacteria bacterium]